MKLYCDIVFMIGSFIFSIALIPTIRAKEKPSLVSSIVTFILLGAFELCYISLEMWLASISNMLTIVCWGILAIQVAGRKV